MTRPIWADRKVKVTVITTLYNQWLQEKCGWLYISCDVLKLCALSCGQFCCMLLWALYAPSPRSTLWPVFKRFKSILIIRVHCRTSLHIRLLLSHTCPATVVLGQYVKNTYIRVSDMRQRIIIKWHHSCSNALHTVYLSMTGAFTK